MTTTFDAAFQNQIITLALRDAPFTQRCEGLLRPEWFDADTHGFLASLANKHFERYRTVPDAKIVLKEIRDLKAAGKLKDEFVDDLKPVLASVFSPAADLSNRDFYADQVDKFARQRAMEDALTFGVEVLEKGGDFEEVSAKVREAQAVGILSGSASLDLFETAEDRITRRIALHAGTILRGITTGHREIDNLLFHKGWGKKELAILMGAAKAGKSTGLAHFAINAVKAGYKVLYTTHENSADVTLDRMDAAIADVRMADLDTSGPTVRSALADMQAKGGLLRVEEFPAGAATVRDIERLIQRYAARGIKFDMLVCDYADELKASRHYQDERFKLKEIYTELRALATTEDLAVLTATQTNRGGFKATTVTATDVGEDWSKMKIADVVISLNSNEEEYKTNIIRLYLALVRNSKQGVMVTCSCDREKLQLIKKVLKVD